VESLLLDQEADGTHPWVPMSAGWKGTILLRFSRRRLRGKDFKGFSHERRVCFLSPGVDYLVAKSCPNVCTAMGTLEHGCKTKPSDMQRFIVGGLRQRVEPVLEQNMQLCEAT